MTEPHVVLIGGSDELLSLCATALEGMCSVGRDHGFQIPEFGAPPTAIARLDAELVLLSFARVVQHGLQHAQQLRDAAGHNPLVLVGNKNELAMGSSMVSRLVDHVITLPTTTNRLRQTIAEVLELNTQTIVPEETVDPPPVLDPSERRHGMRAPIPSQDDAQVIFGKGPGAVRLGIKNLSLEQAGWLGGMLLVTREDSEQSRPKATFEASQELTVRIHLPKLETGLPATARVVKSTHTANGELLSVAIQYEVTESAHAEALSRYWFHLQLGST